MAWPRRVALCPLTTLRLHFPQALKMLAIASSSEIPTFLSGQDPVHPLFDVQMTREIFASIGSATRPGSESLLLTVPAAVTLMLNTEGSAHHPPELQTPAEPQSPLLLCPTLTSSTEIPLMWLTSG